MRARYSPEVGDVLRLVHLLHCDELAVPANRCLASFEEAGLVCVGEAAGLFVCAGEADRAPGFTRCSCITGRSRGCGRSREVGDVLPGYSSIPPLYIDIAYGMRGHMSQPTTLLMHCDDLKVPMLVAVQCRVSFSFEDKRLAGPREVC